MDRPGHEEIIEEAVRDGCVIGSTRPQPMAKTAGRQRRHARRIVIDPSDDARTWDSRGILRQTRTECPSRVSYRKKGAGGWKTRPMAVCGRQRAHLLGPGLGPDDKPDVSCRTCSPAAYWIWDTRTAYEARSRDDDPDGEVRRGLSRLCDAPRSKTKTRAGRRVITCTRRRGRGPRSPTRLWDLNCGTNINEAAERRIDGRPSSSPGGDTFSSSAGVILICTTGMRETVEDVRLEGTTTVGKRHARHADRHQGGRRWRCDLRRQGQLQSVQRSEGQLQRLRGDTFRHTEIATPSGGLQMIAVASGLTVSTAASRNIISESLPAIRLPRDSPSPTNVFIGRDDPNHFYKDGNGDFCCQFHGVEGSGVSLRS